MQDKITKFRVETKWNQASATTFHIIKTRDNSSKKTTGTKDKANNLTGLLK